MYDIAAQTDIAVAGLLLFASNFSALVCCDCRHWSSLCSATRNTNAKVNQRAMAPPKKRVASAALAPDDNTPTRRSQRRKTGDLALAVPAEDEPMEDGSAMLAAATSGAAGAMSRPKLANLQVDEERDLSLSAGPGLVRLETPTPARMEAMLAAATAGVRRCKLLDPSLKAPLLSTLET